MRNVLEAIWWWTRVAVLAVIGVYVLALLFNNSGQTATLWYWWHRESDHTPIITIVVVSFLTGGVVTMTSWALLTAMIGYRRTREARRERLAAETRAAMQQKAAMLRVKPKPIARPRVVEPKARILTSEPIVAPTIVETPVDEPASIPLVAEVIASTDAPDASDDTLSTDKPTAVRSDPV